MPSMRSSRRIIAISLARRRESLARMRASSYAFTTTGSPVAEQVARDTTDTLRTRPQASPAIFKDYVSVS